MNRAYVRPIVVLALAGMATLVALTPAVATAQEPSPTPTPVPEMVIDVSPGILNLASDGETVTVHTDVPHEDVYTAELYFQVGDEPPRAFSWRTKEDNRGFFVANFYMEEVRALEPNIGDDNKIVVEIVYGDNTIAFGEQQITVIDSDETPTSGNPGVRKGKKN